MIASLWRSPVRPLVAVCMAATLALPFAAGCGGKGASTEPIVSIKRDKTGNGAGTAQADGAPVASGASGDSTAAAGGVGSWKGRVILDGAAPALPLIVKAGAPVKDPEVCGVMDLPDERLVVGEGNGVANTFIFLPKAPAGAKVAPPPSEPAIFDQKGCKFIPHAFLVRAGQKVLVKSDDPIAHNTHVFAVRNTSFNSTINPNDRNGAEMIYSKPEAEPVEVKCDFHAWMLAYHFPIDHQFAALSAADGSFEIKDLPAGEHKFRVWHEGCDGKYISRSFAVSIKANETTTLDIPYPAAKLAF